MPVLGNSWDSAINLSRDYGTHIKTEITGSGDDLLQKIKIKVDNRTSSTPTLGLLHKHYDSVKGDLRGVVPERIPLKPRLISMLGCDRVVITNRVSEGNHRIGIKYLGLDTYRKEEEKTSDSAFLQKNQFKYTFLDSYSGREVVGTKTFTYESEEPTAPPVTTAPRRSETQRVSSRRNDIDAPKAAPTKRATMPTPTRAKATSSARPETKSKAPNIDNGYTYVGPSDYVDDETLRAMGLLNTNDEPKPRTMPDEKQARSMSYSNSRLAAEQNTKQASAANNSAKGKNTIPQAIQEIMDEHRVAKVEFLEGYLTAQKTLATRQAQLSEKKKSAQLNKDITAKENELSSVKVTKNAAQDRLDKADRACRKAPSNRAYDAAKKDWNSADTALRSAYQKEKNLKAEIEKLKEELSSLASSELSIKLKDQLNTVKAFLATNS